MSRRIVLLFDGTWNDESSKTNVYRTMKAIRSTGSSDPEQPLFYDEGVGTNWYDRVTGGAFGRGLSANIRQGYQWLCQTYRPGDEVFVFGFSRGAYTARSLVGLIRKCGLVQEPSKARVAEAYGYYRDKNLHPDSDQLQAFREQHSRTIRIHFIGVWDTVGALGVPFSRVPFSRDYYRWHDTELSKIVDYAYHAVAIDENRKDYATAVWTVQKPANKDVEQRWFIGAHANVGGGYGNDSLANRPLRWLQDKAEACGLVLNGKIEVGPEDHLAPVVDSYSEFMFGLYKRFRPRFHRAFGTGVNETVDPTVWDRWQNDSNYRPETLLEHPERPDRHAANVVPHPAAKQPETA